MTTLRHQFLASPLLEFENSIFYQKEFPRKHEFEAAYLKIREKENRLHSDEIVKRLPWIDEGNPNKDEWQMRSATLRQLLGHLRKSGAKSILELGCGNGWLSFQLASALDADVCGVDINEVEILQGGRVFGSQNNLCLLYADIFGPVLGSLSFDAIILGASIQYFQDLTKLFTKLFDLINSTGTIYIADSPIYMSESDAKNARKRSQSHFNSLGFPEMTDRYFHHTFDELKEFPVKVLYQPRSVTALIKRKFFRTPLSVFPILAIKQK
jgi:SAM-dependent methyltransferase